jgi:para-nitrobenzyl esterase
MPAQDLLRGLDHLNFEFQNKNPGMFLPGPVIDDILPNRPIDAIAKGDAAGIKLIIGTNLNEGTMFVRPEHTVFPNSWEMIREMFEKNGNVDGYEGIKEYYSRTDFDRE